MTLRTEELAAQLKPYVIKWMQNMVLQDTIGRHELGGSLHTGQISDSQAPQFLKTDGSRALSGNLNVSEFATIDGIDIDVFFSSYDLHTMDPDAHHALVTVADTSSLNLSISGQQVSGSVIASSDVRGASAEHVLKCDSAGGLNLQTLTLAGDFSVGVNVLTVQTSVGNIGINCVPDAQFDLDIAGNLRAQGWIVGKHAIQVKDAKMICHFDGIQTLGDFTFSTTGHMGQVGSEYGCVYGGVGKFGKGLVCVSPGTNLVPNSDFLSGVSGWVISGADTSEASSDYVTYGQQGWHIIKTQISAVLRFYNPATISSNGIPVSPSTKYTLSLDTKVITNNGLKFRIIWYTSANAYISESTFSHSAAGTVGRVSGSATSPATAAKARVEPVFGDIPATGEIYVDGIMLIVGVRSVYFNGSMLNCSYNAAGASICANTGFVSYAASEIPTGDGSILCWFKNDKRDSDGSNSHTILYHSGTSGNLRAYINHADGKLVYQWGSNGKTYDSVFLEDTWYAIALVKSGEAIALYINGTAADSYTPSTALVKSSNSLCVGGFNNDTANFAIEGCIDELALIDRALSADEIKAIYESDAPIFAETSTWSWRTPNNLAWADANGLWAVDKNAAHAFGVCGVDGYSWGGFGLDAGDIVLGRNGSGSSAIKWDISSGKFGFYGDGDGTPRVEIDTNGELSFSSGEMLMSDSGLRFFGSGTSDTTRAIRWYDNSSGVRVLGSIKSDYGGGGGLAVTLVQAIKNSGDPWSSSSVVLSAIDNITGVDTRLYVNTINGGSVEASKLFKAQLGIEATGNISATVDVTAGGDFKGEWNLKLRQHSSDPATTPGYGILYVYNEQLKFRKSNGTIVTIVT